MAELRVGFQFCVFSLFLISPFSCVHSRTLQEFPKTTVFDVSALFQKANGILSFDPNLLEKQLQQAEELANRNNSSFSLILSPGELLHKSPFKNIRDLTLARLKRDTARVNFIYKKLKGDKTSDISQMDIEVPVTSGPEIGGYFARFGIGTPAKQLDTLIDTGSDVTWIRCASFDPSASSSYKPLACASKLCNELDKRSCIANSCQYEITYAGGGSSTKGEFATETFTIGNSVLKGIGMGCGREFKVLFGGPAGLLGLGGGSVSFPSQINASSFSYCLVDRSTTLSSTMEFGSSIPGDAITTPLLRDSRIPTFYTVALTGIRIGEMMISLSSGGNIVVDSGTTVTRLPTTVYTALRDQFLKGAADLPPPGRFSVYDTCFNITSPSTVSIPTFAFQFGAESLSLPTENFLVPVDTNILCFAFVPTDDIPILGNIQQQGIRVGFDLQRSVVGFSPKSC